MIPSCNDREHTDTVGPSDLGGPGRNCWLAGVCARDGRRFGAFGERPSDATAQGTLFVQRRARAGHRRKHAGPGALGQGWPSAAPGCGAHVGNGLFS
jgi:hypothetical protein